MSIVGELLQRWRLRPDVHPSAPDVRDVAPTTAPARAPARAPIAETAQVVPEVCRLCGQALRDEDVVAVHAEDVVHSDCYDASLSQPLR